jgi:hypothetical protein
VEKFKLPYRDLSCWLDVTIVSVFMSLGYDAWYKYLVAKDTSVRRNEREFLMKMEEVWRCALQGRVEKIARTREAFWKWMESDPSFRALFVAHNLPKFGMIGAPMDLLKCIVDGCGDLDLECWECTGACVCSKSTRSHAPMHYIYIPRLNDLDEVWSSGRVDLTEVVESLFTISIEDLIHYRGKCGHLRRIRFEPTAIAVSNLPRAFIVQNDDLEYNRTRAKPVLYEVSNTVPLTLFGTASYEAAAVITHCPETPGIGPAHFSCQVRVDHPLEFHNWWRFDDRVNEGSLRRNSEYDFQASSDVVALVYTRVAEQ